MPRVRKRRLKPNDRVLYNGEEYFITGVPSTGYATIMKRFRPYSCSSKNVPIRDLKKDRFAWRRRLKPGDFVLYDISLNPCTCCITGIEGSTLTIQPLYSHHMFEVDIMADTITSSDCTEAYTPLMPFVRYEVLNAFAMYQGRMRMITDCRYGYYLLSDRIWVKDTEVSGLQMVRDPCNVEMELLGSITLDEVPYVHAELVDLECLKNVLFSKALFNVPFLNDDPWSILQVILYEEFRDRCPNEDCTYFDEQLVYAMLRCEPNNMEQVRAVNVGQYSRHRERGLWVDRMCRSRPIFKSTLEWVDGKLKANIYHPITARRRLLLKCHVSVARFHAKVYWHFAVLQCDKPVELQTPQFNTKIELKDFQKHIVKQMLEREVGEFYPLNLRHNDTVVNVLSGLDAHIPLRGGVLCLPTGAGKTVCTLSLISCSRQKTLVVVPLTLLDQWMSELERFTDLTYGEIHGRKKDISKVRDKMVVFTTYGTLLSLYKNNTCAEIFYLFDRVVFDESHKLKMPFSMSVTACNAVIAPRRWCLTATPYRKGRVVNLHPQLRMLDIHPFHKTNNYFRVIEMLEPSRRAYIYSRLKHVVLHGQATVNKDAVPHTIHVSMTKEHETLYSLMREKIEGKIHSSASFNRKLLESYLNQLCICATDPRLIGVTMWGEKQITNGIQCASVVSFSDTLNTNKPFESQFKDTLDKLETSSCPLCLETVQRPTITNCLHVFCHACINKSMEFKHECPMCRTELDKQRFREITPPQAMVDQGDFKMCYDALGRQSKVPMGVYDTYEQCRSNKLIQLKDIVNKHKQVVVFSQFNSVLEQYAKHFDSSIITGRSSRAQRRRNLEDFRHGKKVFFLSLKVANVGINLTEADCIVFMEPVLESSVEEQATGRLLRIGQTQKVHLYTLYTPGTIEENITKERIPYELRMQKITQSIFGRAKTNAKRNAFLQYIHNIVSQ